MVGKSISTDWLRDRKSVRRCTLASTPHLSPKPATLAAPIGVPILFAPCKSLPGRMRPYSTLVGRMVAEKTSRDQVIGINDTCGYRKIDPARFGAC